MKKYILFAVLIVFIAFSIYIYKFQTNIDRSINRIKTDIENPNTIPFDINSIQFDQKLFETHYTNRDDILAIAKNRGDIVLVTRGGVVKNDIVNLFFNSVDISNPYIKDGKILMGYSDGFLYIDKNFEYINHFKFNKKMDKCIFLNLKIYCKTGKSAYIYSTDSSYKNFQLKKLDTDIVDITSYRSYFVYLTKKDLYISGEGASKKYPLIDRDIDKIVETGGKLFLLSDRSIYIFENDEIKKVQDFPGINSIISINKDLYFATIQGFVYKNGKLIFNTKNLINSLEWIDNKLYALTQNGYFIYGEDEKVKKVLTKNSLKQSYITQIKPFNSVFLIGYFNKGIDLYNPDSGEITTFSEKVVGINDILVEKNSIYVATTNGLYILNSTGDIIKKYGKDSGLPGYTVSNILKFGEEIYVGTEGGLSQLKGDSFYSIYGLHGLINNRVYTLEYKDGDIYCGTLGGISIVKDMKVIKNFGIVTFKSPWITSLEKHKNNIYIGTYGGGIYYIENREVKKVKLKKRIFINPNAILPYKNNIIFGTLKSGILIYKIDQKRVVFYDELPSKNITSFSIYKNRLLVGSDFGFWEIDIKKIEEL